MKGKHIAIGAALLVGVGVVGLKTYAGNVADEKLTAAIAEMKLGKMVSYDSVSVGILGSVTIDGLKFGPNGEVTVDELTIGSLDQDALAQSQFPTYGDIEADGIRLHMTEAQMKHEYPKLYQLGYRQVQGDMEIDFSYEGEILKLNNVAVALNDVGALSGSLDMGIKVSNLNNPFQLLAAIDRANIQGLDLQFDDDGILDAIEQKEDGARAALLKDIDKGLEKASTDAKKTFLTALRDFIEGGDYIRVSAEPEQALRLQYVLNMVSRKAIDRLIKEGNITFEGS